MNPNSNDPQYVDFNRKPDLSPDGGEGPCDRRHSVLVIGCGSIGERHIRCFSQTGRAQVGACDTDASRLADIEAQYGTSSERDWRDALASGRYTAVVICTPAPLHVPIASVALAHQIHTLVEKPLSHSLDGVAALIEASQSAHCQTAVAYVMRVYPTLMAAKDYVAGGGIGRICQATVNTGQAFHKFRPAYASTYYNNRASGGGAIQDALTHTANWIESVLGPTTSLWCDCAHQFLPDVEVEDTVHVMARHGGVLTSFTLNQFQQPNESFIQFNGEFGSVRIELHRQRWGTLGVDDTDWNWRTYPIEGRDGPFLAQANAFLDQIEEQTPRLCSIEEGAQTLRFNLAALASADSGRQIFCADDQALLGG